MLALPMDDGSRKRKKYTKEEEALTKALEENRAAQARRAMAEAITTELQPIAAQEKARVASLESAPAVIEIMGMTAVSRMIEDLQKWGAQQHA